MYSCVLKDTKTNLYYSEKNKFSETDKSKATIMRDDKGRGLASYYNRLGSSVELEKV